MKSFEGMPLPNLVRYGLTGILALVIFLITPLAVFRLPLLRDLLTAGGIAGLFVLSVVVGFLLDALKLYQFRIGYRKNRDRLFLQIAEALDIPPEDSHPYYSKAVQLEKSRAGGGIFFLHSRWVMMNMSSTLFLSGACLWVLIGAYEWWASESWLESSLGLTIGFVLLIFGLRLSVTSSQERIRVNKQYLVFCRENREQILSSLSNESGSDGGELEETKLEGKRLQTAGPASMTDVGRRRPSETRTTGHREPSHSNENTAPLRGPVTR